MLFLRSRGNFNKTERFLKKSLGLNFLDVLDSYGRRGVEALKEHTPIETGETRNSWSYDIKKIKSGYSITWYNSHVNKGVNIAVILQYGHATGSGGYVTGVDYINPALKPIFDDLAEAAWKEVQSL